MGLARALEITNDWGQDDLQMLPRSYHSQGKIQTMFKFRKELCWNAGLCYVARLNGHFRPILSPQCSFRSCITS